MDFNSNFYSFNSTDWKEKLLYWANENFTYLAWTTGNAHEYKHGAFGNFLFLGNENLSEEELWSKASWKVGILGYDLKNRFENLTSQNPAFFPLPDFCFFSPDWILTIHPDGISSQNPIPESWIAAIDRHDIPVEKKITCQILPQLSEEEYLEKVVAIQKQIIEGNTYEANFCQAYSGEFETWDPISAFSKLNQLSKMPFAALFKAKTTWLVSASPERFLKKSGNQLITQPIKGTISRDTDPEKDNENRFHLLSSEKERAENLMITDLMRNDLAKVSKTGSVEVEELFGIYALPRVFQMISTVRSELLPNTSFKEIIKATFPMGSMTGAPKISTMEIIDREECFKRGWFSGAFGWINDQGDFDFSVVIRSIIADLDVKKLYFGVGSAITIDALASQEYKECALKAQAIFELLRAN
ncbi:MAG: anthranilate synthase component I family protein [Algoriphagus sp.]|jgi:para-aminobenzoate synthetase component 1|nr:anthranilate synthase component I family protein [Algoriphagus sp.]